MEFNFASRLDSFEEGIFATLNDKKNELVKAEMCIRDRDE